ncbi:DgyrCDS1787 [Dimorphilus gyrociliatus]|uniref:DgyrCDS1787 n=1 Tax=Dimorphilus gyrociliatus TaxID=2664684 RepID=A0A7I8VBI8_9ANNE|nr:DgyrCDS1787 [Dimorphilus gyrociliatus]
MPTIEIGKQYDKWLMYKSHSSLKSNENFVEYLLSLYEAETGIRFNSKEDSLVIEDENNKTTIECKNLEDDICQKENRVKKIFELEKGTVLELIEPSEVKTLNKNCQKDEVKKKRKPLPDNKEQVKINSEDIQLKCNYCDFVCSNRREFGRHRNTKHRLEHFRWRNALRGQLSRNVHDPVVCDQCGKMLQNKYKLYSHRSSVHSAKKYVCSFNGCDFSATTSSRLSQHQKCVHNRASFQCSDCGKCFKRSDTLKIHIRAKHTGEKPYSCPHCDEKFFDMIQRYSHLLRKHQDNEGRSFICDICKKAFRTLASKERHLERKVCTAGRVITEDGKSFLICSKKDCKFTTKHRRSLQIHIRVVHEKVKPFSCRHCPKTFALKPMLRQHIKIHQNLDNRERYECHDCGKSFLQKCALTKHRRETHLNDTPHKCQQCGTGFVFPSELKQHMYKHKGIKPYKCRFCGSFFQNVATAWSHEHRVHKEEWEAIGHTLGPLKPVEDDKAEAVTYNNTSTAEQSVVFEIVTDDSHL